MSKQKQEKDQKQAARAAEAQRLRRVRIVLAVLLAAAVLTGAAFGIRALVRRSGSKKQETPTAATSAAPQVDVDNGDYTFVDYKGMQMPAVFASLMEQGDAQREALCADGVVMKVGTREISRMEYEMYYYDQYRRAKNSAEETLETYGQNRSGFDPEKLPAKQYYRGTTTWETRFREQATEQLRYEAVCYDLAMQAGTRMNDYAVTYLQQRISVSQAQAQAQGISTDDLFRESYGGLDVTATLYFSRMIMNAMTSAYQSVWSEDYAGSITQSQLQAAFDADPRSYQAIDARVYMIEDASALEAAAQVRTEQELIAFAKQYHPNKTLDMEIFTDQRRTRYASLSATFGEQVANWLFDENREIGVCGLIEDEIFHYLAVPLSKPYLSTSVEAELFPMEFEAGNEESEANAKEKAEAFRDQVLADGGTAEAFEAAARKQGDSMTRSTVSIGDFDEYGPGIYLFDSARKAGDLTVLKMNQYYLILMFLQTNPEDYDWIDEVKTDLVSAAWDEKEQTAAKAIGKPDDRVIDKAVAAVNDRLAAALNAG